MKTLNRILFLFTLLGVASLWLTAGAQTPPDAPVTLPPELLNTNVRDWQLNGVTILLVVQVLGRAFAGATKGGGIVGLVRGVIFGTNTPKTPEK